MSRSSILNDEWIGARGKQITAEERRSVIEACDCPDDVREDGTTVKAHVAGCRHHPGPNYDYGC